MNDFKKHGGFKGNGSRPSFNRGGDRGFERKEMFPATCVECHRQCEVPFKPTGSKPVYCKDCFAGKRDDRPRDDRSRDFSFNDSAPRNFPRRDSAPAPMGGGQQNNKQIEDLKRQLDAVTVKLDMLIGMMKNPKTPFPAFAAESAEKTVVAPVSKKTASAPAKKEKKPAAKKKPAKKK